MEKGSKGHSWFLQCLVIEVYKLSLILLAQEEGGSSNSLAYKSDQVSNLSLGTNCPYAFNAQVLQN